MKRILPYLMFIFCMSACNKETGLPAPQPAATGSLSGVVAPADAAKSITITPVSSSKSYVIFADSVTGAFSAADLPPGNYLLSFLTDGHYNVIPAVNAAITAGENHNLGTIQTTAIRFSISCYINDVFQGWIYTSSYNSPNLYIEPQNVTTYPEDQHIRYWLSVKLKNVTGPGTYVFESTVGSNITYAAIDAGSGGVRSFQSSANPGGMGTVIITSIDSSARLIKGTFTAVLTSAPGKPADTKVITNGIINATY